MDDLIIFIIYNSVFGTFIRRICRICKFFQILGVINVSCDVFCNAPDRFHQRSDQFHRQPGRAGYSKATLAYWLILCSFEYVMHSRKRMRYAFIFLNHFSEFGPSAGFIQKTFKPPAGCLRRATESFAIHQIGSCIALFQCLLIWISTVKPKSVRADKGRPVGSGLVHRLPQRLQVCVSENGWEMGRNACGLFDHHDS